MEKKVKDAAAKTDKDFLICLTVFILAMLWAAQANTHGVQHGFSVTNRLLENYVGARKNTILEKMISRNKRRRACGKFGEIKFPITKLAGLRACERREP
jgi:hypothetical protein